jgi:hypothetical protein
MRRLPFKIAALIISTVAIGAVIASGDNDAPTLKQISSYRQWTKMNAEPVKTENPINLAALAGG